MFTPRGTLTEIITLPKEGCVAPRQGAQRAARIPQRGPLISRRPRGATTHCYTRIVPEAPKRGISMVQAPPPSSARAVDVDQVLRVDREHLIHPLSHPADHARPLVIVRGE